MIKVTKRVHCLSTLSDSPNDQLINAVLLATTGFFIGGPSNMISSAISADLGRQEALRGSQEALATVTGIVDGTGSIGAAAGQVNWNTAHFTWKTYVVTHEFIQILGNLNVQYQAMTFSLDLNFALTLNIQWRSHPQIDFSLTCAFLSSSSSTWCPWLRANWAGCVCSTSSSSWYNHFPKSQHTFFHCRKGTDVNDKMNHSWISLSCFSFRRRCCTCRLTVTLS